MKRFACFAVLGSIIGCHANAPVKPAATQPAPPVAKKVPFITEIHGDTLVDNYHWLREKNNPQVIAYLNAENAYTAAKMKSTEPLQKNLYDEMLARIKEDDDTVPYRRGNFLYSQRTVKGMQYAIQERTPIEGGSKQLVLDLNELAKGNSFLGIGDEEVSDDGRMLAYTQDITGFREYTLRIKDLKSGETLADKVERVSAVAWAGDNRTLFYVVDDESKRPYRLYRHRVGIGNDELLFEEKDRAYNLNVERTRDGAYVIATTASFDTSECLVLAADHPDDAFKVLVPRKDGLEYYVDHRGDSFYIRADDTGRNFRLVRAKTDSPAKWEELIPHRKDVMLVDASCFADHLILSERAGGLPRLTVTDGEARNPKVIAFPEEAYDVGLQANYVFDTPVVRFSYTSLITPASVFDYDTKTGQRVLLKRQEVLGGYDPSKYESKQLYAPAGDGTMVPVSIVYRKDTKLPAPMLLKGYGSYGIPEDVYFSSANLSLLDRGMIVALAHPRGGGENGRTWADDGKMMKKRNTFTDFIAVAEFLQKRGYTSREKLAITGGSAGGLLMGAVTNMRPDLFEAVIMDVPFVDVVNTMLDDSLPLTTQEYTQWGNPHEKPAYEYIKTYSPYDNIAAKHYPAILIETSLNDSQVMYWEPTKFTAKLRATKTDHNDLLFKCEMGEGHGGASGRYDALKERAFDFAFVLKELGMAER